MVIVPATTGHMAVLPSATNFVADIITVEAVPLRPHRVWLSSPKSLAQPLLIWRKLKPKLALTFTVHSTLVLQANTSVHNQRSSLPVLLSDLCINFFICRLHQN
ncbi:hypothetical protein E1A91_D08G198900v1 [Gossypium mustelinum]|uniref:Uncharacterized protein n=1 Tax=Gossypium mustelinum TaxID=34275 RepID=A0A5D2TZ18_GOSMU|nr:hypothetical protein E1A91_D08G198900v1 [Gossypium mustelinum]